MVMLVSQGVDWQKVCMSVSQELDSLWFVSQNGAGEHGHVSQSVSPQFRDRQSMDMSVS